MVNIHQAVMPRSVAVSALTPILALIAAVILALSLQSVSPQSAQAGQRAAEFAGAAPQEWIGGICFGRKPASNRDDDAIKDAALCGDIASENVYRTEFEGGSVTNFALNQVGVSPDLARIKIYQSSYRSKIYRYFVFRQDTSQGAGGDYNALGFYTVTDPALAISTNIEVNSREYMDGLFSKLKCSKSATTFGRCFSIGHAAPFANGGIFSYTSGVVNQFAPGNATNGKAARWAEMEVTDSKGAAATISPSYVGTQGAAGLSDRADFLHQPPVKTPEGLNSALTTDLRAGIGGATIKLRLFY